MTAMRSHFKPCIFVQHTALVTIELEDMVIGVGFELRGCKRQMDPESLKSGGIVAKVLAIGGCYKDPVYGSTYSRKPACANPLILEALYKVLHRGHDFHLTGVQFHEADLHSDAPRPHVFRN